MKIGVLSDTHGTLPAAVFHHFKDCDEIWHAGDIGSLSIAEQLRAFKPLRAVYGNIDSLAVRAQYPKVASFTCEGLKICIIHIAGKPPIYTREVQKLLQEHPPDILVCGHTHILRIAKDPKGFLYLNPGAIGNYGVHPIATLVRFEVVNQQYQHMEVIEVGPKRYG